MKKLITVLSGVLSVLLISTLYFQKNSTGFCEEDFFQCENYLTFLIVFFPTIVFSVLTYFLKRDFSLWEKFTIGFLILYVFLLFVFPQQASFLQPSRGDLAFLLTGVYIVISIVLLSIALLKSKNKV